MPESVSYAFTLDLENSVANQGNQTSTLLVKAIEVL